MSENVRPILAQYTIRSKQDYIFKTNKMLEIVGASAIISNAWQMLLETAESLGMQFQTTDDTFTESVVVEKMKNGQLNLCELFCGGGNETVLFDSFDTFQRLNRAFTYRLLKECPGIIPMAVEVEYTGNYKNDYQQLIQKTDVERKRMISGKDSFILPFSMMDRNTFSPMAIMDQSFGDERMSEESYSKRVKGKEVRDDRVKVLDEIITKKNKESLLAIVHADGNNMGVKIADLIGEYTTYQECVNLMRNFTQYTAEAFRMKGIEALDKCQQAIKERYAGKDMEELFYAYRIIVADGDDMTFVCNARFVMEYVKAYLGAVSSYIADEKPEWKYSSCAGICIFHSHYPIKRAYMIAEQACDNAKKHVHIVDEEGNTNVKEESWVDFHYIHGGISGDLDEIRDFQNTKQLMARPWKLSQNTDSIEDRDYRKLVELATAFKKRRVSRSNIKELANACENSTEIWAREMKRVYGHAKGLEQELAVIFDNDLDLQRAMYDLGEVYDLWFTEV